MVSHPVLIRSPEKIEAGSAPLLLQRTDARFMANVRNELGNESKWGALRDTIAQPVNGLKLFQPIHRTFHIALVELVCDRPGYPRLDPTKIDSTGLVMRRVEKREGGVSVAVNEGWMVSEEGEGSWRGFKEDPRLNEKLTSKECLTAISKDADPDASRRRFPSAGNAALDKRLAARRLSVALLSELATDLFTLPPSVSEVTKSTMLFGLVQTASLETSPAEDTAEYDVSDLVNESYPLFLQANKAGEIQIPSKGNVQIRPVEEKDVPTPGDVLDQYISFVQQMVIQYDLLGDTPAAKKLQSTLGAIKLPYPEGIEDKSIFQHLREVADALVFPPPEPLEEGEEESEEDADERLARLQVQMPDGWVKLSKSQADSIRDDILQTMRQLLDGFSRGEPQFGRAGDRYVVRAFVRVRRDDECPPDLFWTDSSPAFEIAPWYQNGPAPMPVVQLPDPFSGIENFKPNVAFAVPSSLVDVIRSNKPDKLIEGKGKRGKKLGIAWLCGFNIPLITICAFIVLSIFLSLFQIIFWWLAFIKICIPIPRSQTNES